MNYRENNNGDNMHKVNLDKYNMRCDLIKDSIFNSNGSINIDTNDYDEVRVERVFINNKNSKLYNKRVGNYVSIVFNDITDYDCRNKVINITTKELKRILVLNNLINKKVLVVGLGNALSTPDSLGPRAIDDIITTRHLYEIGDVDDKYSNVSKMSPGVFAQTGIETFDLIKGVINRIDIDYLIIVDALSSSSKNNINKTIQITDSGIDPGSGVGNQRKELTYKTLHRKVIAIGIPTVIDIRTLLNDDTISEKDNLIVTIKDIDFIIEKLSLILSKSINYALHNLTK